MQVNSCFEEMRQHIVGHQYFWFFTWNQHPRKVATDCFPQLFMDMFLFTKSSDNLGSSFGIKILGKLPRMHPSSEHALSLVSSRQYSWLLSSTAKSSFKSSVSSDFSKNMSGSSSQKFTSEENTMQLYAPSQYLIIFFIPKSRNQASKTFTFSFVTCISCKKMAHAMGSKRVKESPTLLDPCQEILRHYWLESWVHHQSSHSKCRESADNTLFIQQLQSHQALHNKLSWQEEAHCPCLEWCLPCLHCFSWWDERSTADLGDVMKTKGWKQKVWASNAMHNAVMPKQCSTEVVQVLCWYTML